MRLSAARIVRRRRHCLRNVYYIWLANEMVVSVVHAEAGGRQHSRCHRRRGRDRRLP